MIIGNHAVIDRNLHTGFLMAGEGVHVLGEIQSDDYIRADVWCKFEKNVTVAGDAYIGEFTTINGKIVVEGDLDIGKEVKLNGGFLSKGWVVVRNPLPVMVFIFLYIQGLIGLGKSSEEIDKALNEMFEDDDEIDLENMDEKKMSEIVNRGKFFVIPIGTKISSESINVSDEAVIGNDCRIETRVICKRFTGGKNLIYGGFLRSQSDIWLAEGTNFKGEIYTSGKLIIGKNVTITGKISAKAIVVHESARIEGKIFCGNIRIAIAEEFDLENWNDEEKILTKAYSFDRLEEIYTEKELVDEEEKEGSGIEYLDEEDETDSEEIESVIENIDEEMQTETDLKTEEKDESETEENIGLEEKEKNIEIENVEADEKIEDEVKEIEEEKEQKPEDEIAPIESENETEILTKPDSEIKEKKEEKQEKPKSRRQQRRASKSKNLERNEKEENEN